MAQRTVAVASASGLHARPAKLFVQEAARLGVPVTVRLGEKAVPARSMLGVLSLGAVQGTAVTLEADGPGAEEALDALAALLSRDLDTERSTGQDTGHGAGPGAGPGAEEALDA
ncbi:Phosphocarrier protein HPr [Nonomuraea coxensis DSM 45129]|uniref:Phosphocarrier protein HPr n=1 Tax=Nonomuraea coxensis DSM 45129 TaxID=1122611 RepID=A0ABX8U0X9_9ACTN|nr:Phosphocarrier protein HPr [Nonomuraea coxensis DSM 45129]